MNINSYGSSYSNSLLNPYTPASGSQATSGAQNILSPSQEALKEVTSKQATKTDTDFNVEISKEARQSSLNATQSLNASSDTTQTQLDKESTANTQTQQLQQTEQTQQTRQTQQTQQYQQMQSQLYQSAYAGQATSRSSIDLIA
ncbi:MAG: hypothetical protein HQK67_11415 [Desulfamplus sp.]|nr:hypothetical protein [Desulfamplus sp.]